MRRRTTFFIAVALVLIFVYAVPMIRMEGCPDGFLCPFNIHIVYYQSLSMHYIRIGAEWIAPDNRYYLDIWPLGVFSW